MSHTARSNRCSACHRAGIPSVPGNSCAADQPTIPARIPGPAAARPKDRRGQQCSPSCPRSAGGRARAVNSLVTYRACEGRRRLRQRWWLVWVIDHGSYKWRASTRRRATAASSRAQVVSTSPGTQMGLARPAWRTTVARRCGTKSDVQILEQAGDGGKPTYQREDASGADSGAVRDRSGASAAIRMTHWRTRGGCQRGRSRPRAQSRKPTN